MSRPLFRAFPDGRRWCRCTGGCERGGFWAPPSVPSGTCTECDPRDTNPVAVAMSVYIADRDAALAAARGAA